MVVEKRRPNEDLMSNTNDHCTEDQSPRITIKSNVDEEEPQRTRPCFTDLPSHIVMNIFCRLPIATIFHCRCVCKTWHNLISDSYFTELHLAKAPTTFILRTRSLSIQDPRNLCMVDLEDCNAQSRRVQMNLDSTEHDYELNFGIQLGNLCNGLVCLCELGSCNPIYIWNPITGDYMTVPQAVGKPGFKVVSGFGFSPQNNRYKVIRIFYPMASEQAVSHKWEAEICELGTGTWRSIGDVPYPLHHQSPVIIYLHGALHWIVGGHNSSELICSFDIGNEQFRLLPPPPVFYPNDEKKRIRWSSLGVLGGCLYICACEANVFRPDVEIWVMKDYGVKESWTKVLSIKDPMVEWWNPYRQIQLIKLLKNGEIVMLCGSKYLFSYNPGKRSFRTLMRTAFGTIVHVPGFVSFKDVVMGDSTKVLNVKSS